MKFLFACGFIRNSLLLATAALTWTRLAAQENSGPKERSAGGAFVSFKNGILSIKGKSGLVTYDLARVDYKTFENNENGPGSRAVDTAATLSRTVPGTVFRVDVETREILSGLDHRVIGAFESWKDGKLILAAVEAPPGFVTKPSGSAALTIDPAIPVLKSIDGGDYKYAGTAGEVLETVTKGVILTARSEFDADVVEVIQMGEPKRTIERYIGQTRGTVRGAFVAFKDGVLKIRGKGITPLAANEYDRVINLRIADHVPIVESIDGEAYRPADDGALRLLKEGTMVTIRKVEEVVLEVRIGVAKAN